MTWEPLRPSVPYHEGRIVDLGEGQTQWMNDIYVVIRREVPSDKEDQGPMIHLSIRRHDRDAARDWRDFQRIKNQLAGEDYEGLEIYPTEDRKVDTANQYHLWCLPFTLGIGLGDQRMVTNHDATSAVQAGAVQRDHEEVDGHLNTEEELADWLANHRRL